MTKTANPILVQDSRGNLVESFHRGSVCITKSDGEIIYSLGNTEALVYPRSALKFFQVLTLLRLNGDEKYGFSAKEIALMCASHNAEKEHIETAQSILKKIDCTEKELGCGAHEPMHQTEVRKLWIHNQKPTQLHNNCSGKHAGFLALAKLLGNEITDYLNPQSETQKAIRKTMSEVFEYDLSQNPPALDGCSAPVYALPLYKLALGFANLSDYEKFSPDLSRACKKAIECIRKYPEMIAGTERFDTEMMQICEREIIGKVGAEGIFGLCFHIKKIGVAVKVDDGKMGPQYQIVQEIIDRSGLFNDAELQALLKWKDYEIKNWNNFATGNSKVCFEIPLNFALKR